MLSICTRTWTTGIILFVVVKALCTSLLAHASNRSVDSSIGGSRHPVGLISG